MKRTLLSIAAACLLFATACGDASTEKVSHGTTTPDSDEQAPTSANTGMADTMSTNSTLPASSGATSGGSNE